MLTRLWKQEGQAEEPVQMNHFSSLSSGTDAKTAPLESSAAAASLVLTDLAATIVVQETKECMLGIMLQQDALGNRIVMHAMDNFGHCAWPCRSLLGHQSCFVRSGWTHSRGVVKFQNAHRRGAAGQRSQYAHPEATNHWIASKLHQYELQNWATERFSTR